MSKFLITASVVSAFAIGFVAPASATEMQNEDGTEYSVNLYTDGADTVYVKTFKIMPGQTLTNLCKDMCSVQIDGDKSNIEAVTYNSKVRIKNGRILSN